MGPAVAPSIDADLKEAAEERYLNYALSVITSRALPDVRDGLKPVQRRILYSMYQNLHLTAGSRPRKSAAIVGDVLGKYHPHGDVAAYEAMVRMAQEFSLRYPLVQGEGNFGSLDGDGAAAMRYTEAQLTALCEEMLEDLAADTVPFRANYDSTLDEPIVLPSAIPQLLMNGSTGIAVGMATNIPPHNLARDHRRAGRVDRRPEARRQGSRQAHQGSRLPDRRRDPERQEGDPRDLRDRAGRDSSPRRVQGRDPGARQEGHRRHVDPLHRQQVDDGARRSRTRSSRGSCR